MARPNLASGLLEPVTTTLGSQGRRIVCPAFVVVASMLPTCSVGQGILYPQEGLGHALGRYINQDASF